MKKLSVAIIALFVIITCGFTASMIWNVSNEEVTINFELPDEGTKGTISGLKATIDFDHKDPSTSKIEASVDFKTLNSGNKQKDDHLKAADIFDAEKYPTIKFSSSSIKTTKEGFLATGSLTIKDSIKTVEIPFTFTEEANGSGILKGSMTIHTSDFGVMQKGKDKVVVTINVPVKK